MARPGNWRELIAVHGWGTAPARIMARTRTVGECIEWTGPLAGSIPQIRVCVPGHYWVESAPRVVWMFVRWRRREFVPDGLDVKRSCGNQRCLRHLVLSEPGLIISEVVRQRTIDAHLRSPRNGAKLSSRQVATIRRWRAEGRSLTPLVKRYGVNAATIYNVANGFYYREPGTPRPKRHADSGWRALDYHRFSVEECAEMLSLIAGGESYNAVAAYFDCRYSQVGYIVRGSYRDGVGGLMVEDRPTKPRAICGQCCLTADDCGCVKRTAGPRRCSGCDRIAGHNVRTCDRR